MHVNITFVKRKENSYPKMAKEFQISTNDISTNDIHISTQRKYDHTLYLYL